MRTRRGSLALGAWVCVGATTMAGCAGAQEDQTRGATATFTYACCSNADVAQVVHPGEVLRVHWIASPGPPTSAASPVPVSPTASLTGPYADVAHLKTSVGDGAPTLSPVATAGTVQTTSQAGGTPVSTIAIPPDARPGLYDLTTAVESSGFTSTGGSIVRIEASTTP